MQPKRQRIRITMSLKYHPRLWIVRQILVTIEGNPFYSEPHFAVMDDKFQIRSFQIVFNIPAYSSHLASAFVVKQGLSRSNINKIMLFFHFHVSGRPVR